MANATDEGLRSQLDGASESQQQRQTIDFLEPSDDRKDSCTQATAAPKASTAEPNIVTHPVEDTAMELRLDGSSTSTSSNSRYRSAEPLVVRQSTVNSPITLATSDGPRVENTQIDDGELYMSGALPSPPATPVLHEQLLDYESSFVTDKPKANLKLTPNARLAHSRSSLFRVFHTGPHEEAPPRTQYRPAPSDHPTDTDVGPSQTVSSGTLLHLPRKQTS